MRLIYLLVVTGFCFSAGNVFAQEILPEFTVKNNKGKVSVSWQNKYTMEIKGITVQRSYDSTKNFSSITIINNPNDVVHGFMDIHAPYTKMFYRLFIALDSGLYFFTDSKKPELDPEFNLANAIRKIKSDLEPKPDSSKIAGKADKKPVSSKKSKAGKPVKNVKKEDPAEQVLAEEIPIPEPKKEIIPYPSKRIYTGKDNNIVISLPDFNQKKYAIHFYDEDNKLLFVINKVIEGYFIIEKVNFLHAGWFNFEIHEDETLLEKNKFFIPKD